MNEGRGLHEWDYLCLGERRTVAAQILNRSKCDKAYAMKAYETDNPLMSNGVPIFEEPVLCTYIDLDALIEGAGQSKGQARIVEAQMLGYGQADIADHLCVTRAAVNIQFNRAVDKIVAENDRRWRKAHARKEVQDGDAL